MKSAIAISVLLAVFVLHTNAIQRAVSGQEQATNKAEGHRFLETTSPTPDTYVVLDPPSPPPSFSLDQCERCGNVILPFDFRSFKSDIESVTSDFIVFFTSTVLDPNLCLADSASCLQTLEDNRAALNVFQDFVASSLQRLDIIICEQDIVGPYTPECSLTGLNITTFTTIPDGRRLQIEDVDGIEGNVRRAVGTTEDLTTQRNILKGLIEARDVAKDIYDALPECGGALTGDACAASVSALKISTVAANVASRVCEKAALVLDIEISNKEDSNGAIEFEYTETTHDNVIEAHRKLDSIRRGVDEANVKLDEAIRKLDSIQEGLNEANQKLDELLCPFEGVPEFTVLGQGCDTIDQNCNGVRDECAEDKVPPTIELKVPLPDTPFKSNIDALAFLSTNVIVSDDCAVKFQTDFQLLTVSDVDCCDCEFQVTTEDERCVNDNNPGTAATASRTFLLKVDRAAPVISCGFFTQQDPLHVAQGFDACEDLPVPFPGDNDPLHVDQACFGQGLFDVRLWYQIEDECDDGVLPVTVRVLSNEFSEEKMTLIVERNDLPNMVHRAQVYISPISCQDMSTGGSGGSKGKGQSKSTICEVEETENDSVTTRFYDVVISASDAAGNVGTKTCSVIVIPANHYCGDAECGSKGSKSRPCFGY
ncbi:hypothetical protein IV203_038771 [Nitzschia inconspicua]|uniref:Uncharacterized protein n=1 Tax=Nitzschia inconspicua TaxID=303405 RepID=A0A9K3LP80_9STRA|nr:hypothetical protein IV203_038771 [Nitzschia inconspicua]